MFDPGKSTWWTRGLSGERGGLPPIQVRGQAWALRTRVNAAALAPDGSAEKAYFTALTNDAIAMWEGERGITGTAFEGTDNWNWGKNIGAKQWGSAGVPPLSNWAGGDAIGSNFVQEPLDPSVVGAGASPWEQNFMLFALGRAKETGFQTGALISYLSKNIIGQLTGAGYDPHLIASYRIPVKKKDGTYFRTWSEARTGYIPSLNPQNDFTATNRDAEHGYANIAIAATAAAAGTVTDRLAT